MSDRNIQHDFPCSEEIFWKELFWNEEFNRECYLHALKFERWQVVEQREIDGKVHRVVEAVPPMGHLPAPLKKLLEKGNGYRESGIYDPASKTYRVEVFPQALPDKLEIKGLMSTRSLSPDSCRRTYLASVTARLFGVGGLLEQSILDGTAKAYDQSAAFSLTWLRSKGI